MSVTAITIIMAMGRWEPDAPGRLQRVAFELYRDRGYEQTTVAEIAAAAGVTERTFFRHFADKREVFFHGTHGFEELWVAAIDAAPAEASAVDAMGDALDAAGGLLEGRRAFAAVRQQILADNPELYERELAKLARIRVGVADALRERGTDEPAASVIAASALAIFLVAFDRWVSGADERPLPEITRILLDEMAAAFGSPAAVL